MSLAGSLEKLYARRRFGICPGPDRVRLLLERLGNPERSFRAIHVVGTNGKGSTSAFLSSILGSAGYRTALFTSPHLVSFNERFRINGQEIASERLMPLLERVLALAPDNATFFEIVTALAALCFAEERTEIAVLEAGMGGRSDATAVIPAIMTVITPVSLDHCDYLGTTLEGIAAEKAGIAEPGTPMIIAAQETEVDGVILNAATAGGNRLCIAGRDFSAAWREDGTVDYKGVSAVLSRLTPGIPGRFQAENSATALAAAEIMNSIGWPVSENAMTAGIRHARWPGRMELIAGSPPMLLDGAHNPAGAAALASALGDYRYRRLILVAGVMADKECREIFAPLAHKVKLAFAVTPAIERALDSNTLAEILTDLGINATASGSVADGIRSARQSAGTEDLILICGSLFTVGETKAWLAGENFEGIRG